MCWFIFCIMIKCVSGAALVSSRNRLPIGDNDSEEELQVEERSDKEDQQVNNENSQEAERRN